MAALAGDVSVWSDDGTGIVSDSGNLPDIFEKYTVTADCAVARWLRSAAGVRYLGKRHPKAIS